MTTASLLALPVRSQASTIRDGVEVIGTLKDTSESIKNVFSTISNIVDWIKDIPDHVAHFSVNTIIRVYELTSNLILKTPLWIFNNSWFENTTHLMSVLSIGIVTILTMVEGFKRKFQKKHVSLDTICKRWFLVSGLTAIAPPLAYNFFKLLNLISDKIISLGSKTMQTPNVNDLSMFDVVILLAFSLALMVLTIPTLLNNARRFFDILTLIIVSPLAGTAYIFDPYSHLFNQWWSNLKSLSMVQVVYAFFLLVIGLLIYGIPTPPDTMGIAFKFLIVLGGFSRLMNPPKFVQRYLDQGDGIDEAAKSQIDGLKKVVSRHITKGKNVLSTTLRASRFILGRK